MSNKDCLGASIINFETTEGFNELRGLISGHFWFTTLCRDDTKDGDDEETRQILYDAVKDVLVPMHAHYRPGLRPWAWWKFDAPEPRRVVGDDCTNPEHDDDCDGNHPGDDRLPAAEDPNLPAWAKGKLYFGTPSVYDGYLYESEYDYLAERSLLFPEEIAIFDKFGSVINVRVQSGECGKCKPCWQSARETAKKIVFDLEAAIQRYEFWIPGDLYVKCEHYQYSGSYGIFLDAD